VAGGPVKLADIHLPEVLKQFRSGRAVAGDETREIAKQDVVGHTSE
jgi:hypothetical protein